MEEKVAVAVVDRGGGGNVKGSLDTSVFLDRNMSHTKSNLLTFLIGRVDLLDLLAILFYRSAVSLRIFPLLPT